MRELCLIEVQHISGAGDKDYVTEKNLLTNYPFMWHYPSLLVYVGVSTEVAFLSMCGFHLAGPAGAIVGALVIPSSLVYSSLQRSTTA
ncbi:MAG: hypothetical protein AB7I18_11555 [Candidatus Berkiella sp.]